MYCSSSVKSVCYFLQPSFLFAVQISSHESELVCLTFCSKFELSFQFFWALGSTFMVIVSLLVMPTLGWRWLLAFATLPVVIFIILCKVILNIFLIAS